MKTYSIHKRLRGAVMLLAVTLAQFFFSQNSKAFALMGPYADWMTWTNGFDNSSGVGGPMNIGEGYRWNVPVVTYAFDPSFVDAFGSNGVVAVESAIAILNNLPPASQLDPSNFPLNTMNVSFPVAVQSLEDLKSTTLALLLQQLGLAAPSRYCTTLHDFSVAGGVVTADFLERNYDPFSLAPTNAVNTTLYTNLIITNNLPDFANWFDNSIDPFAPTYTAVADRTFLPPGSGDFFTGLTRDDVGGLRYLLRPDNYAVETLLPDVHGAGTNLNHYADLALRGGVDKISFVRQDYDPLTGQAYIPLTNDFIDVYLTNNVVTHQQLERIVSKPDFIFSAYDPSEFVLPYSRTGASNWINNAAINGMTNMEGPGTIRPQVNIAFEKYGTAGVAQSGDVPPFDSVYSESDRWASFDGSTNPPIIFSDITASKIDTLQVTLVLNDTNYFPLALYPSEWTLPVGYGQTAILQTSSNLVDWVSRVTFTNYGVPADWTHFCTASHGFFRAIPQTNPP